jgi:hypothetical protein
MRDANASLKGVIMASVTCYLRNCLKLVIFYEKTVLSERSLLPAACCPLLSSVLCLSSTTVNCTYNYCSSLETNFFTKRKR